MKFFTKEVKIALVAIVGIVVLFYGLQFLKGLTIFSNDQSVYVTFDDVSGLSASSPVYANGYKVGVVKGIEYDYNPQGKIEIDIPIDYLDGFVKGRIIAQEQDKVIIEKETNDVAFAICVCLSDHMQK